MTIALHNRWTSVCLCEDAKQLLRLERQTSLVAVQHPLGKQVQPCPGVAARRTFGAHRFLGTCGQIIRARAKQTKRKKMR